MAINKVVYGNTTLIDLTDSTLSSTADLRSGVTAYDRTGTKLTGTGGTAAISVVDTTDTAGGTIRTITALDISDTTAVAADVASGKYFYTAAGVKTAGTASGGSSWSWMGENPTLVKTYAAVKVYLSDTNYGSWTPSSSIGTIVQGGSELEAFTTDTSYDYLTYFKFHSHLEYEAGTTGARPEDLYSSLVYFYGRYASNISNITAGTVNSSGQMSTINASGMSYYNYSGAMAYIAPASSGIYPSINQPTGSDVSLSPKTPTVYARCNSSYFSTTAAAAVIQSTSYYEYKYEIWRVEFGSGVYSAQYNDTREMWLNGF